MKRTLFLKIEDKNYYGGNMFKFFFSLFMLLCVVSSFLMWADEPVNTDDELTIVVQVKNKEKIKLPATDASVSGLPKLEIDDEIVILFKKEGKTISPKDMNIQSIYILSENNAKTELPKHYNIQNYVFDLNPDLMRYCTPGSIISINIVLDENKHFSFYFTLKEGITSYYGIRAAPYVHLLLLQIIRWDFVLNRGEEINNGMDVLGIFLGFRYYPWEHRTFYFGFSMGCAWAPIYEGEAANFDLLVNVDFGSVLYFCFGCNINGGGYDPNDDLITNLFDNPKCGRLVIGFGIGSELLRYLGLSINPTAVNKP